jgi:hypothetical protein
MSDAALVAAIRALLSESPFHGEGYRKIPPRACCARFLRHRIDRLLTIDGRACALPASAPRSAGSYA